MFQTTNQQPIHFGLLHGTPQFRNHRHRHINSSASSQTEPEATPRARRCTSSPWGQTPDESETVVASDIRFWETGLHEEIDAVYLCEKTRYKRNPWKWISIKTWRTQILFLLVNLWKTWPSWEFDGIRAGVHWFPARLVWISRRQNPIWRAKIAARTTWSSCVKSIWEIRF